MSQIFRRHDGETGYGGSMSTPAVDAPASAQWFVTEAQDLTQEFFARWLERDCLVRLDQQQISGGCGHLHWEARSDERQQ
jgi:hypothetical protein